MSGHIVPVDFKTGEVEQGHEQLSTCHCHPKLEVLETGDMIFIHFPMDGSIYEEMGDQYDDFVELVKSKVIQGRNLQGPEEEF